jgi:hypothetical protein
LYIANSRIGLDRGIGKRTCKNRSVIDYFISFSSLFPFKQKFDINDYNLVLSDIHNSMHISLKNLLTKKNTKHTTATQQTKSVKWNDSKRDDFVNMVHIQHNELTSILGDLENIQLNNECSQQDINNIMNKFWKCLKQVGKRYSRVKIREIHLSKTQNFGMQANVMNTEKNSQSKKNIQFTQK